MTTVSEREKFFAELSVKVDAVTKDWPEWKHHVLRNSFRSSNTNPRPPIVTPKSTENE